MNGTTMCAKGVRLRNLSISVPTQKSLSYLYYDISQVHENAASEGTKREW